MPQGQEWVPGYWNPADGGFQWVSGFWRKDTAATAVNYLPQEPPKTLEQGPVGAAPSADYVWVPGHWVWWHEHYAWRPGFWAAANPDWIWMPAHYVWTPNGYIFVDGHWDYCDGAPRRVLRAGRLPSGRVHRTGFLLYAGRGDGLQRLHRVPVLRPGCYCFGNYYGPAFVGVGIYPWFGWHGRYGYDPCFAYYGWRYHGDPGWRNRLVVDYRFRIGHPEARPPVTFAASLRFGGPALAVHINVFAGRGGGMRFERIGAARRAAIRREVREQHMANARRAEAERRCGPRGFAQRGNPQIEPVGEPRRDRPPARNRLDLNNEPTRGSRRALHRASARRPGEK